MRVFVFSCHHVMRYVPHKYSPTPFPYIIGSHIQVATQSKVVNVVGVGGSEIGLQLDIRFSKFVRFRWATYHCCLQGRESHTIAVCRVASHIPLLVRGCTEKGLGVIAPPKLFSLSRKKQVSFSYDVIEDSKLLKELIISSRYICSFVFLWSCSVAGTLTKVWLSKDCWKWWSVPWLFCPPSSAGFPRR